jgi:hypothetical protein
MHVSYRVHYPLVSQDTHRDFATLAEAEVFAAPCVDGVKLAADLPPRRVRVEALDEAHDCHQNQRS